LDAWRGGAETSTLQFIHRLMEHGVELHVFTRSRPSPAPGLQVHTIPGASMSRTRQSVTFTHRVERALRADTFDVIHAISPCRVADIYQPRGGTVAESIERNLALIRSKPGRTLKRYADRFNLKKRYLLALEREMLGRRSGPVVVAISDYVVDQLHRHYHLPDRRIRKVYNGVDPDVTPPAQRARDRATIRKQFGIPEQDLLVLLIAHNFRLKGVHRWMEALAQLRGRGSAGVRSLVVGKGDSQSWHRLAARMRLQDALTFVGPSERIREFHHAADVLVHPTYYDPCSRVVLEAMAAGLPCVTTRWDGASEMIRQGRNGFILPEPEAVSALAERVVELRDVELRRRVGQAAADVAERVSMARHASGVLAIYRERWARSSARRIA
jgi:UDP-glucose:(heptosyl)LPS alpha-1,3-glucosyltransferase